MTRIFDFLRTSDVPALARRNLAAELRHMALWGCVVGSIEGPFASVVASKTFGAPELLTSLVFATPIIANLLNILWSVIIRGRPRVRTFTILACGVLLGLSSIALNSAAWQPWSAWLFAGQVGLTHLFLSGLVTLRTTMWKANYPGSHRAQIAGRIQTLRLLLSLLTVASLSALFDRNPDLYRYVYPGVAVLGLLSLWPLRRMRMRGERAELRRLHMHLAERESNAAGGRGLWAGLKEAAGILRTDRVFAAYMSAQFLLGSANFFTDPVLVNVLTRRFDLGYSHSTLLLYQVPTVMVLISIRFWARFFDRVGVLRFRIYNSGCWLLAFVCVTVSMAVVGWWGIEMLPVALVILFIGRILSGTGNGGGAIAWNIGHLHFAREHQTELYMGIHVALTGLRGLLMPLAGWTANYYLGYWSFGIALVLAGTSFMLFRRMAAADDRPPRECAPDREELAGPRGDVT
ncbi:MAG: hypothetical protein PVJ57_10105 [Phycisphaerae bacterium]|jgi:hypothetical protein